MHIRDLQGTWLLDAVDYYNDDPYLNAIRFRLNKTIYKVVEDPEDRYRSVWGDIKRESDEIYNTFKPTWVRAVYTNDESQDTLTLVDYETNAPVLIVGTSFEEDQYPLFIYNWWPENLSVNR